MTLKLLVEAFREGTAIPQRYTADGENRSPALAWQDPPFATRSFALIIDDPDAPVHAWSHWLLWDLPPCTTSLAAGFKPGDSGVSGSNDFGNLGYGGPSPPRGDGPHRYFIRLLAIGVDSLRLPEGARRGQLDRALRGHVLAEALYMGRYERR